MENSKKRELPQKNYLKIDPTHTPGTINQNSTENFVKKLSLNPYLTNMISPTFNSNDFKSDISNQRKSAMTPVYLKEFNSNLINPDYISSTLKQFPQANKDENKLNYNSIERKISGSVKNIDNIKKKKEDLMSEEGRYKIKDRKLDSNVDKLIKTLKCELSDMSRNIKTSEEKVEKFVNTYNRTSAAIPKLEKINDDLVNIDQNVFLIQDLKRKNDHLNWELNVLKENYSELKKQYNYIRDQVSNKDKTERSLRDTESNKHNINDAVKDEIKENTVNDNPNTPTVKSLMIKLKERDSMLNEKEKKIKELKQRLSIYDIGDNKMNSVQNIISELIKTNKNNEKIIKGLNEELDTLKSNRITSLNINNTQIHKLYQKDSEDQAWALISKKTDTKLENHLINNNIHDVCWVSVSEIEGFKDFNLSNITNLYEIQEKYEKIKEVHVKMSKELEEAQQFIIQNIKNKENNLKLVQKEFQMYQEKIKSVNLLSETYKASEMNLQKENSDYFKAIDVLSKEKNSLSDENLVLREECKKLKAVLKQQFKTNSKEDDFFPKVFNEDSGRFENPEIEMKTVMEEVKRLKNENENYQKNQEINENILQETIEKVNKLEDENQILVKSIENLKSEKNEFLTILKEINDKYFIARTDSSSEYLDGNNDEIKQSNEQHNIISNEITEIEMHIDHLKKGIEEKNLLVEKLSDEKNVLLENEKNITNLINLNREVETSSKKNEEIIQILTLDCKFLNSQNTELIALKEECIAEIKDKEFLIFQGEEEIKTLQEEKSKTNEELKQANIRIKDITLKLEKSITENQELDRRNNQSENIIDDLKASLTRENEELIKESKLSTDKINNLSNQSRELQDNLNTLFNERNDLSKRLTSSETLIKEQDDVIAQVNKESLSTANDLSALIKSYQHLKLEIEEIDRINVELTTSLDSLRNKNKKDENLINSIRDINSKLVDENSNLNTELNRQKEEYLKFQGEKKKSEETFKTLLLKFVDKEKENKTLREKYDSDKNVQANVLKLKDNEKLVAATKIENQTIKQELDKQVKLFEEVKLELDKKTSSINKLEEINSELKSSLEINKNNILKNDEKLASLTKENSKIIDENCNLMSKININEENHHKLQKLISSSNKENQILTEQLKSFSKSNEEIKSELNDKIKNISILEKSMEDKERINIELTTNLESLKNKIIIDENQLRTMREENSRLVNENSHLNTEQNIQKENYLKLQKTLFSKFTEKEKEYNTIKEKYDNHVKEFQKLANENSKLSQNIYGESEKVKEMKKLNENLILEKGKSDDKIIQLSGKVIVLEQSCEKTRLNEETIEKNMNNYVNLINELEKYKKDTQNVILDLTNQLKSTQKELENLKTELENKCKTLASTQESNDLLRQGVDKKNQEISKIMEKLEESEQKTSQTEGKFLKLNEIFGNNLSKLKAENEGLKSKMTILETKNMENESKNNKELSNKTNEEIVKLKKLIEEKDLILKEKDDVLNNLEKDFIQFKHNEKSLMEEKTSLLSRVRGSMKSFEELHIKTSELDKEKSQLRKEIEASNLKVKNFEEEISIKTKQNEKIISEYQNTIESLKLLNEGSNLEIIKLNSSKNSLISNIDEKEKQLREYLLTFQVLEESNRVLQDKVNSLDSLHKVKVEEMFKLSKKSSLLKHENQTKSSEIKSNFEEQIKSLTEEKNKITVINERLAENLYRLTEKANLNEKEIEELKNKIIQLENNLRTKIERTVDLEKCINCNESKINNLSDKIAQEIKKYNELEQEMIRIVKSCNDSNEERNNKSLEQKISEIKRLNQKLESLTSEKENTNIIIEELKTSVEELKIKNKDLYFINNSLKENISTLEDNKKNLACNQSHLEAELNRKGSISSKNSSELTSLQTQNKLLSEKISEITQESEKLKEKYNELESKCIKINDDASEFRRNSVKKQDIILRKKTCELANLEQQTTLLIEEINVKKFLLTEKDKDIQSKIQEIETLLLSSQELKKKVVQLETTQNNSKVTIDKLSQELEITKKNFEGTFEELKKKCLEIDELHRLSNELKKINQSLNKELEKYKTVSKEKNNEIKQIIQSNTLKELDDISVELQNSINQNYQISNQLNEAQEEIKKLKFELEQTSLNNNNFTQQINKLLSLNDTLNNQVTSKQNELLKINENYSLTTLKLNEITVNIDLKDKDITTLNKKIFIIQAELNEKINQLGKEKTERNSIKSKFDEQTKLSTLHEKTIKDLNETIQALNKSLSDKESILAEGNQKINKLNQEIIELKINNPSLKLNVEHEEIFNFYKDQVKELKGMILEKDKLITNLEKDLKTLSYNEQNEIKETADLNFSSITLNSQIDEKTKEKVEKLKQSIRNYKDTETHLSNQINVLKSELNMWKEKYNNLLNFEGKIKNFDDFKSNLLKVLENYKPKKDKKEYEEAFKRIRDHTSFTEGANSEKKKEGFFNNLFK